MRHLLAILAVTALLGPAVAAAGDLVGPETCKACHPAAYASWREGPHARAQEGLGERSRNDRRCLACHAPAAEVGLAGVGCEACHGAGRAYASRYVMRDAELAHALGLAIPSERTCAACHTEATPSLQRFDFKKKVRLIAHPEPRAGEAPAAVAPAAAAPREDPVALQVVSTQFLKTATRPAEWPRGDLPEIAFVGRSNVGKSSMLNALSKARKLARVSATPGRTRALQFFEVRYRPSPKARPRPVRFCDLPGYGYAKVSREERARWTAMIDDYLKEREALRAVVLIVDSRHEPMESDRDALRFLTEAGRVVVVAATKIDKLARSRRGAALQVVERAMGLPKGSAVPFSAEEGTGAEALWARIHALAGAGAAEAAGVVVEGEEGEDEAGPERDGPGDDEAEEG